MKDARAAVVDRVRCTIDAVATRLADYVALTKPRLNLLVVATSAAGYYLGATGALEPVADGGSGRGHGARGRRRGGAQPGLRARHRRADAADADAAAAGRPRLAGRRARSSASRSSAAGLVLLGRCAPTVSAAALALATLVIYLVVYTPMKRRSPLATLVGAVPGALPPLIGWAASHGSVGTRRRGAVR